MREGRVALIGKIFLGLLAKTVVDMVLEILDITTWWSRRARCATH